MKEFKPEGVLLDTPENRASVKSFSALKQLATQDKILEARAVMCDGEHNLIVDLGFAKGIIPREEGALGIKEGTTRDIALISRVNKPVCFTVSSAEEHEGEYRIVLSRRRAQELCMERYIKNLVPGDIVDARVTHLEPFGCFADIGCGIASLIPIDLISVSRISHPGDRFRPGFDIKAVVKTIDQSGRIGLSHKELLGTWQENADLFEAGQTVSGIVRSVENYGVFVELTPNLAGLAEPREGAHPGQHASVYIKSLLPDKMKVKLIIVDSFEAQYGPAKPEYFIESGHIDYWCYSPEGCGKTTESFFSADEQEAGTYTL